MYIYIFDDIIQNFRNKNLVCTKLQNYKIKIKFKIRNFINLQYFLFQIETCTTSTTRLQIKGLISPYIWSEK